MEKLWFAANAGNWELANYAVNELREAMETAKSLHAVKNGVDIKRSRFHPSDSNRSVSSKIMIRVVER